MHGVPASRPEHISARPEPQTGRDIPHLDAAEPTALAWPRENLWVEHGVTGGPATIPSCLLPEPCATSAWLLSLLLGFSPPSLVG